jgi:hypothetical protein
MTGGNDRTALVAGTSCARTLASVTSITRNVRLIVQTSPWFVVLRIPPAPTKKPPRRSYGFSGPPSLPPVALA